MEEDENKKTKAKWIWIADWSDEDKHVPLLILFRKRISLASEPKSALLCITADTKYKLFVNGTFAEVGPSRGDRDVWFYDKVEIAPFLIKGENVIAVQVLRYPVDHFKGNHGMIRTEKPALFASGAVSDTDGTKYPLNTNSSWKVMRDMKFRIVSESEIFAPLQIYENAAGDDQIAGWKTAGYANENLWQPAWEYQGMNEAVSPGNLFERTIPFMFKRPGRFEKTLVVRHSDSRLQKSDWDAFLAGTGKITVPAHSKEIVEISAGQIKTAYLHLALEGGAGSHISILQSESYIQEGMVGEFPKKGHREDWQKGKLAGFTDTYTAAGYGTADSPEVYEPFWFRTFRFVRLEVETGEEPLVLSSLDFTQTGYPLEVKTKVSSSDEKLKAIWQMSERTLRLCMHETYEDCPFYEQLQYAMDTRSQILYTYAVSADDRLARKSMDDFRRAQRSDGLLNCSYPNYEVNVIPGFSIFYVLMVYDHMMYFGDKELAEEHFPTIDKIMNYFHRHLTADGYVGKIGGLNGKARFWSFIDWTPEWDATTGVPPATLKGAITMESLLYVLGLQRAADIAHFLGRSDTARIYRERAAKVQAAVRDFCVGKNGMMQDGPGIESYSQHTQVFAILTDTIGADEGARILKETILDKERYPQCSVAMAFYLFRALQKVGLYRFTKDYWNIWNRMLAKGATTCVENEVGERSDCHAWGALILYELPAIVLGVRPAKPGFEAIQIRPETGYLTSAEGEVVTPKGVVKVKWSREPEMRLKYEIPEGIEIL